MARRNYDNKPISPLTLTYNVLYRAQRRLGREYLTYKEARRIKGSTPGIIFTPGTTFREVLGKLERIDLAKVDEKKELVYILKPRRERGK